MIAQDFQGDENKCYLAKLLIEFSYSLTNLSCPRNNLWFVSCPNKEYLVGATLLDIRGKEIGQ